MKLVEARAFLEQADRLITETYPLARDPKLFIPALRLVIKSCTLIDTQAARTIAETITEKLDAYADRVVEFPRGDVLVYADDQMRTTTLSLDQVTVAIDEAKRAYAEAYA